MLGLMRINQINPFYIDKLGYLCLITISSHKQRKNYQNTYH